MLATFDGPARAVRCAQAICGAVRSLGIEVRAGLHTGEIELRGDDIGGIAVHIGQRVSALAGPGEVLVSSTVKDLVAGSGITFADRGSHVLKGVPDEWRVFSPINRGWQKPTNDKCESPGSSRLRGLLRLFVRCELYARLLNLFECVVAMRRSIMFACAGEGFVYLVAENVA